MASPWTRLDSRCAHPGPGVLRPALCLCARGEPTGPTSSSRAHSHRWLGAEWGHRTACLALLGTGHVPVPAGVRCASLAACDLLCGLMVTASFFCSCPSLPDGCPGMTRCCLSRPLRLSSGLPVSHQPRAQRRTSACPAEAPVWSAFLPELSWTPWSASPPLPGAARSPNALLRTDQTVLRPRAAGCPPESGHLPLHVQAGFDSLGAQRPLGLSAPCAMSLSCWVLLCSGRSSCRASRDSSHLLGIGVHTFVLCAVRVVGPRDRGSGRGLGRRT